MSDSLKKDGTEDKRFASGRSNDTLVNVNPVLAFQGGYMQFEYLPVKIVNGTVSNGRSVGV